MRNFLLITIFGLLVNSVFGHGLTLSTIEEAHSQVEYIFVVKVTDVSKPKEQYTGAKTYPVHLKFEFIEALKGAATVKTKAVYYHPAIELKLEDGNVLRAWLKVLASGKELSVTKGGKYLIYAPKTGIHRDIDTISIVRIDPISEKDKLIEAMKKVEGSQ